MLTMMQQQTQSPARPLMEAQQMELCARWDAAQQPHDLWPGTLVEERPGMGYFGKLGESHALIFWRSLDTYSDFQDQAVVEHFIQTVGWREKLDCILAMVSDDGSNLLFYPHSTAHLQPAVSA